MLAAPELFERVQRPVDADDVLDQRFALLETDFVVLDQLSSLEALAPEVLLRRLHPVALALRNCVPALDLEDERLEVQILSLDLDLFGMDAPQSRPPGPGVRAAACARIPSLAIRLVRGTLLASLVCRALALL